jgi:serine/threonine protein kinase
MEARPGTHPSPDVLRALASGQLDDATAEAVVAHLEGCPACCQAAGNLSGDSLLRRLRAAQPTPPTTSDPPGPGNTRVESAPQGLARPPDPAPMTPEAPPAVLPELRDHPQYEVLRELDRGGMGVVYLAKNRLMDRLEVLKVVNKALLGRPGLAERFLREIRAAAQLRHPNIVTAYAALQVGELLVFAMEYVEGENLSRLVKSCGPLPVGDACSYAQQAALGLQHAFEKGMVHRDIKPSNLILSRDGKTHAVRILDFGLAKARREQEGAGLDLAEATGGQEGARHGLTRTGQVLGTPGYMAPEQSEDAARADSRADIYSLGCTLYFLLTGRPPFQGKSLSGLLQTQATAAATPVSDVRPEVPAALAAVVAKMMAKDPARRYQMPAEVAQALAPFITTGVKPPPPPEDVEAVPPSPREVSNRALYHRRRDNRRRHSRILIDQAWKRRGELVAGLALLPALLLALCRAAIHQARKRWGVLVAALALLLLAGVVALWRPAKTADPQPDIEAMVKEVAGIDLVWVRAGEFSMGSGEDDVDASPDEKPRHRVRISKPFYLGKYEVKDDQFSRFVKATGYKNSHSAPTFENMKVLIGNTEQG